MSTTAAKRSHHQAMIDAIAFRNCVPNQFWHRWEFAGSLRRNCPDVGDVEHVIIPVMTPGGQGGLFTTPAAEKNTLWERIEEMVRLGTFAKHVYQTVRGDQFRWGEKYCGIDFRGFNHEIFCADARNWGSVLAIRTGPGDYSRQLVTALRRRGNVNRGGYVRNPYKWDCLRCMNKVADIATEGMEQAIKSFIDADGPGVICERCGDTMEAAIIDTLEESDFFNQAGMPMPPPERRA